MCGVKKYDGCSIKREPWIWMCVCTAGAAARGGTTLGKVSEAQMPGDLDMNPCATTSICLMGLG